MTSYPQGSARAPTDYGQPLLGVDPTNLYSPVATDAEGRLLAAPLPPTPGSTDDAVAAAAGGSAVITYLAPGLGLAHCIDGLVISAAGTIATPDVASVELSGSGGDRVFAAHVGSVGITQVLFPGGLLGQANASMVITVPSLGGSAYSGVSVQGHRVVVVDPSARWGLLDFRQPSQSQYLPLI